MPRTRLPRGWIVRPPKTLKSTRYRYRYKYRYKCRYRYKYKYKHKYRYRGKWARSPTHAVAQSAVADLSGNATFFGSGSRVFGD